MFVLFLMPIVGRWQLGHRFNILFMFALVIGIVVLTGIALYEDSGDPSFQAAKRAAHRDAARIPELIESAAGIGPAGAAALLANDPFTQGPRIFSKQCAACHRYDGHDGQGMRLVEFRDGNEVEVAATAADLGNFGSREWVRSVLVDYKNHFAALDNATWNGEKVGPAFLEDGEMVAWSEENKEVLLQNEGDLAALVEFVVAQSGRVDLPSTNSELVARGREIFELGELSDGELTMSCIDCHSMHAVGDEEPLAEGGTAPTLTGYGSAAWLKQFVSNPAASDFYADSNAMPAFEEKLAPEELELLVRWLTGDYVPSTIVP